MEIKVLAFGHIVDMTGRNEINLMEISDTNALRHHLAKLFPGIEDLQFSIAVNRKIIHFNTELKQGDVVALLPPFSGG